MFETSSLLPDPKNQPVRFARVLLDQALDRPLDYALPSTWAGQVDVGSRVRVPLQNRVLPGTVLELTSSSKFPKVREAIELLDEKPMIRPVLLRLAKWMAEYYCCGEETALRAVLPQVVRAAELGPRRLKAAELTRPLSSDEIESITRRAPKQAAVLELLAAQAAPVLLTQLNAEVGQTSAAVAGLCKRGLVRMLTLDVERDPHAQDDFLATDPLTLNPAQQAVFDRVRTAIDHPSDSPPLLLHGVTGSGKTEVYLQAVDYVIRAGRQALVLVPEISLTPQTVERFKGRFAALQKEVAVLHSNLSDGERHDEWFKIHAGRARVVIGARSAVFAPLDRIGLIVVDEEHENSYKQEEIPRYHARDLAVLRSRLEPCAILLGSATPSAESFHNSETGKYELLRLDERVDDRKLPVIRILDMRVQRRRSGPDSIFSAPLTRAVIQRLERREQVILFLNRRGYSTSLICPACGHVCRCPHCSVTMTFHREDGRLLCHICGHTAKAPHACPACSEPGIRYSGAGTQKVEEAVAQAFPKARVARMDADAMTRKDSYRETLGKFRAGTIDILVGTQMIAKGLDFPNVTLVGIINADLGLHLPDFRAGERTFQLLTQVAGRAGRGEMEGEVMVQTFTPFAAAIQFARHHDYRGFWEQEREFRERFHYPPFARMILLTLRSPHLELAEFTAQTIRRKLAEAPPAGMILGEAIPAPLAKAKGFHRFQISMRGPAHKLLARHLRAVLEKLPLPAEVHLVIDVDPFQLL